jgi:hypothetical protein
MTIFSRRHHKVPLYPEFAQLGGFFDSPAIDSPAIGAPAYGALAYHIVFCSALTTISYRKIMIVLQDPPPENDSIKRPGDSPGRYFFVALSALKMQCF